MVSTLTRLCLVGLLGFGVIHPLLAQDETESNDALSVAARQVAAKFVVAAEAKRGEVADVDATTTPTTIYVLLGSKDGVAEGQLLTVVAKGEPIEAGGETVGFREKPVGTAEIARVQSERLSVATMKTVVAGEEAAKGNLAYLKTIPGTLAVSTFLRSGGAGSQMGQEFADKLGAALQAGGRFKLLERSRFDGLLAELKLGLNDLFDPTKTVTLGKQLQAKGVILGTIAQQNDKYTIAARVVDLETGTVVGTAVANCPRTTEVDAKYGQSVVEGRVAETGKQYGEETDTGPVTPTAVTGIRVLYVGSDDDMVHNEGVKRLLAQAGFAVDAKPALPSSLSEYAAVIYDKTAYPGDERQQRSLSKVLYSTVGRGAGVVLGGFAPWQFGDLYGKMRDASAWVGCAEFDAGDAQGGTVQLARSRPFGFDGNVGGTVHQFAGSVRCFTAHPEGLEASAQAIAQLVGRSKWVGAYANRYGEGRLYWQYLTYHPNSPKLNELFVAGVRWAAGLVELDGSPGPRAK